MTMLWLIIALVGCLIVQAFFAASEIALVSADDLKVRAGSESGHARSRVLGGLLANRDRLLALTLTGTNVAVRQGFQLTVSRLSFHAESE